MKVVKKGQKGKEGQMYREKMRIALYPSFLTSKKNLTIVMTLFFFEKTQKKMFFKGERVPVSPQFVCVGNFVFCFYF